MMEYKKENILMIKEFIDNLAKENVNYGVEEIFAHSNKEECLKLIEEIEDLNEKVKVEKDRSKRGELTFKKGSVLEELATKILNVSNIYASFNNIKCDSNEIDVLLEPASSAWVYSGLLPKCMLQNIIIECKNYNKKIDVTWTGKLFSLAKYKSVKTAILFSYLPIKGRNEWDSAKGLVKKIYLKDETLIINITVQEIKNILEDKIEVEGNEKVNKYSNIVSLIKSKVNEIQFHTSFEDDISKHPAELA